MKKISYIFIFILVVISCNNKERKTLQTVAKDELSVVKEINPKTFKPENVKKLFYAKDLKSIDILFEDKDFFEKFSKTPYAIGIVIHFFSDEIFSKYVEKLKGSNLPVMEYRYCLLSAIVDYESDSIPWLLEQGISPYEVIDYNGLDMNAFDCIDWQKKTYQNGQYI
ncbi:MAG: hypothetical protein K6E22_02320 [Treponema sp.]|nr:hypothetical protein [Treponema sp.]